MIGKENGLRLLKKIIDASQAGQTEAILMTEDSSLTRFTPSAIHQHVAEKNETLILRAVLGKRVAVVTTNNLQPASLRATLAKALALAGAQPPNEAFVSLPPLRPIPQVQTYQEDILRLTPKRRAEIVRQILGRASGKGLAASGAISHGQVEVAVANSLGVEAYQQYSDLFLHMIVGNGPQGSGYAGFVARGGDRLNVEALVDEAAAKASGGGPVAVEPGEYEVILEPYAVHELLSFLSYLGFHALAVQEGRSFFCNQLGRKMVSEQVTLYDDGLDPEGLQVPFDFEGQPKEKVTFFERGVARSVTYDSFTAGREGRGSTGHALLPPNMEGPIPCNLFMQGGESSVAEMVRSVRRGIYVTRFHYTNVVEPMQAVITGMTRDGTFLIEEGEIKGPVKNLRFTESVLRTLSRVSAVSRERKLCSPGTVYSRRFVTGTVVPAIKVDGFNFSG